MHSHINILMNADKEWTLISSKIKRIIYMNIFSRFIYTISCRFTKSNFIEIITSTKFKSMNFYLQFSSINHVVLHNQDATVYSFYYDHNKSDCYGTVRFGVYSGGYRFGRQNEAQQLGEGPP